MLPSRCKAYTCRCGEIGRHVRFRDVCRKACRFESGHLYKCRGGVIGSRAGLRNQCLKACRFESGPRYSSPKYKGSKMGTASRSLRLLCPGRD